jgi:hypothetical protein
MSDQPNPDRRSASSVPPSPASHPAEGGIGFGVFLVLAGLALLAERMGWVPNAFDWLFPVILIAWGASELYRRLGRR